MRHPIMLAPDDLLLDLVRLGGLLDAAWARVVDADALVGALREMMVGEAQVGCTEQDIENLGEVLLQLHGPRGDVLVRQMEGDCVLLRRVARAAALFRRGEDGRAPEASLERRRRALLVFGASLLVHLDPVAERIVSAAARRSRYARRRRAPATLLDGLPSSRESDPGELASGAEAARLVAEQWRKDVSVRVVSATAAWLADPRYRTAQRAASACRVSPSLITEGTAALGKIAAPHLLGSSRGFRRGFVEQLSLSLKAQLPSATGARPSSPRARRSRR